MFFMLESLGFFKMEVMVVFFFEALVNVIVLAGSIKGKFRMVVVKERKLGFFDGLENSFF